MGLSYAKLYHVLMKSDLPASAKTALAALADLRQLGVANPKIEALSRQTGLSDRTIRRALGRLQERGLLRAVKGQRQNLYRVAPLQDWPKILPGQNDRAETNPARSKRPGAPGQNDRAEPAASLLLSDSSSQTRTREKESSRETPSRASTRAKARSRVARAPSGVQAARASGPPPDLGAVLAECREIYGRAGVPFNEQAALQLMLSKPPEVQARMPARLPNYLKWALATGRWPSPAKTKSLPNLLHDGDWDVELTLRDLPPPPRKPSVIEQKEQEYLRRHAKGGSS